MDLTRIFEALPHTKLSQTLAQHPKRDWVRQLGDIAWQACVRYRHGLLRNRTSVVSADSVLSLSRDDFAPSDPYTREFLALVTLRAMIAAAASDDGFTDERRVSVLQRICMLELPVAERMVLMQEIQRPLAIEQLARYGRSVHAGASIYAASLITADLATPSALLYLTALADALALSPALVAQIHRCVDAHNESPPTSRFPDHHARSATL